MSYMNALKLAANKMGFNHWSSVPDECVKELTEIAMSLRGPVESRQKRDPVWLSAHN